MSFPWPREDDPIVEISYELVAGFNEKGEPIYERGIERDPDMMRTVQTILEPLKPSPASFTSVTMGSVDILLKSGAHVALRPVFHPSSERYKGLFKVEEYDCPMPDSLAAVLNGWRDKPSHD